MIGEFDILAAKVLAQEASEDEQARLREIVSQSSDCEREFKELEAVWNSLCKAGPLLHALGTSATPLPHDKLLRLQETVRKKFNITSNAAQPSAFPNQAGSLSSLELHHRDARSIAAAVSRKPGGGESKPTNFKQWLRERTGSALLAAAVALLLLAVLAVSVLFGNRSPRPTSSARSGREVAAYLLVSEGESEVWRAGKQIAWDTAIPLEATDKVRLRTQTEAHLITPRGAFELAGPKQFLVGEEVIRNTAANAATPQSVGGVGYSNVTSALRMALFRPAGVDLAPALLVTTRGGQSIPLYSPLGSTADLTPLILWKSEPGKTYNLTITDELDPKAKPLALTGTVSPVDFANVEAWKGRTLARDGLYRITLMDVGQTLSACEYTFRTLEEPSGPSPSAPAEKLLDAYRILASEPARVGDALGELLTLPPAFANSELSMRLKLLAFGQQGYKEDFDAIAAWLNRTLGTRENRSSTND